MLLARPPATTTTTTTTTTMILQSVGRLTWLFILLPCAAIRKHTLTDGSGCVDKFKPRGGFEPLFLLPDPDNNGVLVLQNEYKKLPVLKKHQYRYLQYTNLTFCKGLFRIHNPAICEETKFMSQKLLVKFRVCLKIGFTFYN